MSTYFLISLSIAVFLPALYLLLYKGLKWNHTVLMKIIGIFLAIAFAVRYMTGEVVLINTLGLDIRSPFNPTGLIGFTEGIVCTLVSTVLIWLTIPSLVLIASYPFFKNTVRSLTGIVKYIAFPVYIANFILFPMLMQAMSGIADPNGYFIWSGLFSDVQNPLTPQGYAYAAEIGISIALCLITWFNHPRVRFRIDRIVKSFFVLIGALLVSMPTYALQVLIGTGPTNIELDDFTVAHRLVLYGTVVVPIIITLIFIKCNREKRRYALLFMSFTTLINYCYKYTYEDFFDLSNWPLHLCNTAMFIIPLCLAFRLEKLFYFTLFINVLGAFVAMLMPDITPDFVIQTGSMEFWLNHYCAFFMPLLAVTMKIYSRPRIKHFIYSIIAFAFYFAFVLVLNAYLGTDFFFLNDDFIVSKLGDWAEALVTAEYSTTIMIGETPLVFYPIYQIAFFISYICLALAMWFLYEQMFQIEDLYTEIVKRNKRIRIDKLILEAKLEGRSISEPMNLEGQNKLVLRNFSKKYGTSDVYAVKNASLEIEGGQIFGFLGPNGAGKSTIIKSIVGIQSITSGSIEVCGYDVEKQSVGAKMQTGFVPDHYALYENLTGREYVNYIADLYGVSKADRTARIDEYVTRFRLEGAIDNPMKTYSHGMKQKITIMSALVHNPKLWILDEPLTGLDPESIFQVKEAMKKHAAEGNIVFFSSHIIDVVERICDRIAIIKKGTILCEKSVAEIEKSGVTLENFYMQTIGHIPPEETDFPKTKQKKGAKRVGSV